MNKHRCYVQLNRAALRHNLARVRELAPNAQVMAVIKADGYGHGVQLVVEELEAADEFAVTTLEDAHVLRSQGINKPLTLLSAQCSADELASFAKQHIRPVIYDYEQLSELKALPVDAGLHVWLKVDTGMGRLGFSTDELPAVKARLDELRSIASVSLMTHLANADQVDAPANQEQFQRLANVLAVAEKKDNDQNYQQLSVLNSAGIVSFSEQAADMVRPGLMLYGISPTQGMSAHELNLTPVMEFKSSVISVRRLPAGTSIGYGGTYILDSDSRVAYIGCGYGDGYPRHAPNGTTVLVNDFLVPLVGRVSMDMIAVDIGELPVQVGDSVTLWGENNPVEDIAAAAGTIAYELTCGITNRVIRELV